MPDMVSLWPPTELAEGYQYETVRENYVLSDGTVVGPNGMVFANTVQGQGYDVVLDGTDNFPTRYLLNDASLLARVPVVHGSIFRFEGQVTVFNPYEGPCYRCLLPEPPPPELAPSCSEAGVIGVLPGIVGSIQALEAIKIILGLVEPDASDPSRFPVEGEQVPLGIEVDLDGMTELGDGDPSGE